MGRGGFGDAHSGLQRVTGRKSCEGAAREHVGFNGQSVTALSRRVSQQLVAGPTSCSQVWTRLGGGTADVG